YIVALPKLFNNTMSKAAKKTAKGEYEAAFLNQENEWNKLCIGDLDDKQFKEQHDIVTMPY
ncbi:unnamed protein product, partial [Adineta steineri]